MNTYSGNTENTEPGKNTEPGQNVEPGKNTESGQNVDSQQDGNAILLKRLNKLEMSLKIWKIISFAGFTCLVIYIVLTAADIRHRPFAGAIAKIPSPAIDNPSTAIDSTSTPIDNPSTSIINTTSPLPLNKNHSTQAPQNIGETARLSKIIIVDSKNRKKAIIEGTDSGATLSLHYNNETTGAVISIDEQSGGALTFFNKNGTHQLSLTALPSAVICADNQGAAKAVLGVSQSGDGVFSLHDSNGIPIIFKRHETKVLNTR